MKTWISNLLKQLLAFLKKNAVHVLYAVISILIIIYIAGSQKQAAKQAARYAKLQQQFESVEADRQYLEKENNRLVEENKKFSHEKDSIKKVLAEQTKEMDAMKKKHQHEIDSLKKIPADSAYIRLQPIYPNYDSGPLSYPFSGVQVSQIYISAVSLIQCEDEYMLQSKQLRTCSDLNTTYAKAEKNWQSQNENLKKQIDDCDKQIGIQDKEIKQKEKELRHKKFWNWTYKGVAVFITILAIVK